MWLQLTAWITGFLQIHAYRHAFEPARLLCPCFRERNEDGFMHCCVPCSKPRYVPVPVPLASVANFLLGFVGLWCHFSDVDRTSNIPSLLAEAPKGVTLRPQAASVVASIARPPLSRSHLWRSASANGHRMLLRLVSVRKTSFAVEKKVCVIHDSRVGAHARSCSSSRANFRWLFPPRSLVRWSLSCTCFWSGVQRRAECF